MKYFAYFATCHFFGLVVTYDIFDDISSALNAMGNEFSKVPDTMNTGINAIGNEFSKVPDTVNTGINAIGNEFSKVPHTVNSGINAIGNEFSKVPDTVNTGMNAIGKEVSKVPKWISDVGCSEFVTGIVINLLIKCNPHAFITDTLDTEDIIMMNTCKSIEVVSYVLPLIADLATSPVQIVCSVWIEDRLELYSHLKGIDVHTGPSGTNFINNDELFYNLSKLNDQHCNNDCNLDDYVFIKLDERNESSADTTSSPSDVTRFKRGIFGKALSIPTKVIVKKYTVKAAPKLLMKNGVTSTLAFRGLNGLVSNKMTTKTSVMIFNIIENKPLDKVKNVYDVFVLTKTVPTTFTRKYYNNVYGTYKFGREAAENFQRDLTKKESKLLQTLIQHIDN